MHFDRLRFAHSHSADLRTSLLFVARNRERTVRGKDRQCNLFEQDQRAPEHLTTPTVLRIRRSGHSG